MGEEFNRNDLLKIQNLLNQCEEIPDTAHVWITLLQTPDDEDNGRMYAKIWGNVTEIKRNLRAFIKVKLGDRNEYVQILDQLDFHPKIMGIAIITSDLSHYHRAWYSDKVGLKNLLRDIEAEVKIRIESRSDEFSALKSSQEKRLKRWSIFYFFILSCLILVPINWWFFKEVIDWNNAELFRPFTWVDKDKFGSGELIIGVFWLGIDGSYLANFIGLWRRFDRWYFKMFRAK